MDVFADTHTGSSHSRKKGCGAEVEGAGGRAGGRDGRGRGRQGPGPRSPVLPDAQAPAPRGHCWRVTGVAKAQ